MIPAAVWKKIEALDAGCAKLADQLEQARSEYQRLRRQRRNLRLDDVDGLAAVDAALAATEKACDTLDRRLLSAQGLAARCREHLFGLSESAVVSVVEGRIGSLDDIRNRIKQVRAEIGRIEATPIPSDDLKVRIGNYVASLADKAVPLVKGIAAGEKLAILWPLNDHADRIAQTGLAVDNANPLLLMALLHPETMVERLMEISTINAIPPQVREARLAELRAEETELRFDEERAVTEALANGEDARRMPSSPPWAVLMIKVEHAQPRSEAAA
jgi:hypothetical protein